MATSIFTPVDPLPRGPHDLDRSHVAESQRGRLMTALAELLGERGWGAVTIGALAGRARVSRGAFYEHFADKEACLAAAYDRFAAALVRAMTPDEGEAAGWDAFVEDTLAGYLGTLEREPVAARAFIVEMDAAGPAARRRRREAIHAFAALLAHRHAEIRERDPSLGPLPQRVYLGIAFGVRELVREQLETQASPALSELAPDIVTWITATVQGAADVERSAGAQGPES